MTAPIPIEFKLSGSNKIKSGLLHGYNSHAMRIEEGGVLTYYSYHYVDYLREV